MESPFASLQDLQRPDAARALSRKLGTDERATGDAIAAALPTLISALQRNATDPDGARALSGALSRDHDGSVLTDLLGSLAGGATRDGGNILEHVLGSRRAGVEQRLGRRTGLDASSMGQILATLAPLVLGALGKSQRQQGWDPGGLADALGGERVRAEKAAPGGLGPFERMLDMDGDGDVTDDVARIGGQLLGGLFGGRR